jgi:hypothetical protein
MKIELTKKDAYSLLILSFIIILLGIYVFKMSIDTLAKEPVQYIHHTEYFQIPSLRSSALMLVITFSGLGMISAFVILIKILLNF